MSLQVLAQAAAPDASGALGVFAGLGIVFVLLAIVTSIFWIWMLIDCATNANLESSQKVIWVLIILFLHFLGALIYFVVARGSRPRVAGG